MQNTAVDVIPTGEKGVIELRVRLDLTEQPLLSPDEATEAELERTCLALVEARCEVERLRAEVAALEASRVEADLLADAAFQSNFVEATVEASPIQAIVLSAPSNASTSATFAAPTPAFAMATASHAAPAVNGPRRATGALHPTGQLAQRITDTLSGLDVDFGVAHAIGQTFGGVLDRALGAFGVWRASEWDDSDELRDTSGFAPVVPWYRRSTVLIVLIAVAALILFGVGSLERAKGKRDHALPVAVTEPTPSAAVVPAAAPEHTNLLAGTPFDPGTHGRSRRR